MMKANRIHRFGPPEVIVFKEIAACAGEGEILVISRARKTSISHDCGARKAALRDAKDRVERLRATLGRSW
jgi:hypothetical protein